LRNSIIQKEGGMILTFTVSPCPRDDGDALTITRALTANGRPSLAVGASETSLGPREILAVTDELLGAASSADWVVLCGPLPPAAPPDLYALLIRRLRGTATKVALTSDWPGLCTVLGRQPDVLALGARELEQAAGFAVREPWEALAAIERVRGFGPASVLASLGGDGAVLADETGTHHADAPGVSGDARDLLLAGFLAAGGRGQDALVEAVAWAAADGCATAVDRSVVELTWVDALELAR
jgi:fructose-1-phosphate kinase PfkB-like protein